MVIVVEISKLRAHFVNYDGREKTMSWLSFSIVFGSIVAQAVAKSLDPTSKLETWEPNYCNDSKSQENAGLTKTALGQFLGYACDSSFFQCRFTVEGWKTYKKVCRKGLVFDRAGTQNCNYDFNVEGCGMKQCADCIGEQYACCLSEECVDLGLRCDGKYDCSLEEDEQNCPSCSVGEFPCVLSEQCIPLEKRCNGIKECKDGTDELHCDECDVDMFWCRNTKKCIEKELRCDGNRDCNMGEDEAFCANLVQKDYKCEDQQHEIPKKDVCNGFPDCPDGSDEMYCNGIAGASEYEENTATIAPKLTGTGSKSTSPSMSKNVTIIAAKVTTKFPQTLRNVITRTFPRILTTPKPLLTTPRPKNTNKKSEDYFYEE